VQRQYVLIRVADLKVVEVRRLAPPPTTALGSALAPRVLNQDVPHGSGRGGEEVAAALPAGTLALAAPGESEVRLVYQSGGLERQPGTFAVQLAGGKSTQLIIDKGQELLSRLSISSLNSGEYARHVVHRQGRL
jgi:hypothetical protein